MKQNKGVIGIGLVLVIVLGIAVVGGGAYYLGTRETSRYDGNWDEWHDKYNQEKQNNLNTQSSIKVLSPNGGEVYNSNDKILIKWESVVKEDMIAIYLKSSNNEWCLIKDVPSTDSNYIFEYYNYICNPTNKKIISGQYKITLISYNNDGMAPEPGTAFAGDFYNDNGVSIDSSDNYFTINSAIKNTTSCISDKGNVMTYEEALKIAKASSCNNIGTFTGEYGCNKNAGGLIDVYMTPTDKPLCGLSCRISIDTKKAEEGWMCTGALKPIDDWKTYTNSEYGFTFNYPSSWKLSEDKLKKEVTIDTNDKAGGVDGMSYPSWRITFISTDKSFFNNNRVSTKMGIITYDENLNALVSDSCIKAEGLLGTNSIQAIRYGGSLMSDPAYSNSAILTTSGKIINVDSYQGVPSNPQIQNQLSEIIKSFGLLNGNIVFVPQCAK